MKLVIIFLWCILTFSTAAIAYPQEQLRECILSVKQNPVMLGAPEISIENFCKCTLKYIFDEGKPDLESANQCGSKYFR